MKFFERSSKIISFLLVIAIAILSRKILNSFFVNFISDRQYLVLKGETYNLKGKIKKCTSKGRNCKIYNLKAKYKIVYEINFDCSVCLIKLQKIYHFYQKLKTREKDVIFCIISSVDADSFVKFHLNRILKNYNINVCKFIKKRKLRM